MTIYNLKVVTRGEEGKCSVVMGGEKGTVENAVGYPGKGSRFKSLRKLYKDKGEEKE